MKVKCINSEGYQGKLKEGAIYELRDAWPIYDAYYLVGVYGGWKKHRFVLIPTREGWNDCVCGTITSNKDGICCGCKK